MGRGGDLCRRKLFLKAWIFLCMLLNAVTPQSAEGGLTQCEIETIIRELTNPNPEYQMHIASLRNQLRSLLGRKLPDDNFLDSDDSLEADKRSIGSLARNGFLNNGKRYVGSLARSDSLRSQFDTIKRSLATLAKNGQLPSREPDYNDSAQQWSEKRNLGSLARSGYLAGKRNIGSLARDFQLPSSSTGKRNIAALARDGLVPSLNPKRNMASLARTGAFPAYKRDFGNNYWSDDWNSSEVDKRNLGALKNSPVHGSRQKRDIGYDLEIADPVMQNAGSVDYDELRNAINQFYNSYLGVNNHEEKRFLGSVARSGWYQYRPSSVEKRNLQSLARNGMLRSDLARTDSSSHKSDFDNPSWEIVDDATLAHGYSETPLVGVHPDYRAPGAHHHDSQLYTGEVYDVPNLIINSIDDSNNNKHNNDNYYSSVRHPLDFQLRQLEEAQQQLEYGLQDQEQDDNDNNLLENYVYNVVNNNSPYDENEEINDKLYEFNVNANYLY
ncbi:neuropeptide-like 1 isoform X1 [Hermetia illucens]|uniref:neuropeptide-like 1 isoform X1 n=1 Tax=Hermetia illucens TaxID=343691 RepID=UPI0018CC3281|nr:neuropeptide-like 1 isoform X1 [Hermetia illucens]